MSKTFKLYGIIFIVIMVILGFLELSKKDVTDWRKNYDPSEKTPFGLYIFDQEINTLLNSKVTKTEKSPYNFYHDSKNTSKITNILVVEKHIDNESWKKILSQVKKGSDLLVISENLYGTVQDTLDIPPISTVNYDDVVNFKLTDEKFKNDSIVMDKLPNRTGYRSIGRNGEILGSIVSKEGRDAANFVRYPFGKGSIYIHTDPLFVTNYYMLKKGDERYIQDVFSYLPDRETVWFVDQTFFVSSSPLRFVLSKPALKYAWWTLLGGLLLFVFFNAKRKQRIVPIIEPLKNQSAEFVRSIGNLYLQEGDFHDMMAKKAQYFLSKVRMDLLLDTKNLDENFAKKLHLKTGKNFEEINEAINLIRKGTDPYADVTKEDLIRMNTLLDNLLK